MSSNDQSTPSASIVAAPPIVASTPSIMSHPSSSSVSKWMRYEWEDARNKYELCLLFSSFADARISANCSLLLLVLNLVLAPHRLAPLRRLHQLVLALLDPLMLWVIRKLVIRITWFCLWYCVRMRILPRFSAHRMTTGYVVYWFCNNSADRRLIRAGELKLW